MAFAVVQVGVPGHSSGATQAGCQLPEVRPRWGKAQ